jgi:hypothetical protein
LRKNEQNRKRSGWKLYYRFPSFLVKGAIKVNDEKITNQTAFGVAGIPTPSDQEDVSPTDMISGAVEEMMDNIQGTLEDNILKTTDHNNKVIKKERHR